MMRAIGTKCISPATRFSLETPSATAANVALKPRDPVSVGTQYQLPLNSMFQAMRTAAATRDAGVEPVRNERVEPNPPAIAGGLKPSLYLRPDVAAALPMARRAPQSRSPASAALPCSNARSSRSKRRA